MSKEAVGSAWYNEQYRQCLHSLTLTKLKKYIRMLEKRKKNVCMYLQYVEERMSSIIKSHTAK